MVRFNTKDYNIAKIMVASGLSGVLTKNTYKVLGKRQDYNPMVVINCAENENKLFKFFTANGITYENDSISDGIISIGFRRDVRRDVPYCSRLLKMIVAFFEGNLELDETFKLPQPKTDPETIKEVNKPFLNENGEWEEEIVF